MYWNQGNVTDKENKLYAEAAEYGIVCKVQDLKLIVERLDKYLKKTKVRGAGLVKRFGVSHGQFGTRVESWSEWRMEAGASRSGCLTDEQGLFWHFALNPNRHYHIDRDKGDVARETYAFPERKDLVYNIILIKHRWFYEHNGKKVYVDSDDVRQKRELFFQGLLECIGFPLEVLHIYDKDEERIFR